MHRNLIFLLLTSLIQSCSAPQALSPETVAPIPAMTATELAESIRSGQISSQDAIVAYLTRIEAFDRKGPMIQSVIALNPNAMEEARVLDTEAQAGQFRGRLHGVPVLVKDNIETRELPTTAGSLALLENDTGRDAPIIANLRAEGAIILGKANLSEWANFRSNRAIGGWSGVGGQTRNPHSLDRSPCGSSAGSAAAVAAFFAPMALGTETNGSITCPAAMNGVVGFKPTVGLLSRTHIIPISLRQDSAGPIARSVADAAMALTIMAGSDPSDPATLPADQQKQDYVETLDQGVDGMRIGVFRWAEGNNPAVSAAFNEALQVLTEQGAVLVQITEFEPDPVMFRSGGTLLDTEFPHALNAYLATTPPAVTVRSLTDLIAFNDAHATRELALFDQSILIRAQDAMSMNAPEYLEIVTAVVEAAREKGIDQLLAEHEVELLVMPSARPASPIDVAFTSRGAGAPVGATWLAAMAGYPALSVPMGEHIGLPLGLLFVGTAWDDATVLAAGYAYEVNADKTSRPHYANGPFEMPKTRDSMRPYAPER